MESHRVSWSAASTLWIWMVAALFGADALAAAKTWTGGDSMFSFWTTANNWSPAGGISAGDILIFPDVAARKTNTNNLLPAPTFFNSIQLNGAGYVIGGNLISLGPTGISENAPAGAQPQLNVPIRLAQPQTFTSNGIGFQLGGGIDLNGFTLTVDTAAGPGTTVSSISGGITGAGGLVKNGANVLSLGSSNTYTGITQINAGTLRANGTLGASGAGNHTVVANGATLEASGGTASEAITLNGTGAGNAGALLGIGCAICTVNGAVTLASDSAVNLVGGIMGIGGVIGESGGARKLTLMGTGVLQLTAANTYTGGTSVTSGRLHVTGSTGNVTVTGGTLSGTGTVGAITGQAGTPHKVKPGASPGLLSAVGNVTFVPDTTFDVEIGGLTPGNNAPSYSQLNVTGTVNLGGATLLASLAGAFMPNPGDQFTIIQSTGAISGQFAQGTSISFGGKQFVISYKTNSVVLTTLVPNATQPDFTLYKTHAAPSFSQGQLGAVYTVIVTNLGSDKTIFDVLVSDTPPPGLTLRSLSGAGWSCGSVACLRSDPLARGASYPPITITVDVAADATSPKVNNATLATTAQDSNQANNSANDSTVIVAGTQGSLTVTRAGTGTGTVTSTDGAINCGAACASAYVNGSNIQLNAAGDPGSSFTGWSGPCSGIGTCTVPINGAAAVTANFTLAAALPDLTITKTHSGNFVLGQVGATYTVIVTNSGGAGKPAGDVVTVTDTAQTGLTVAVMSGTGWTCASLPACTRSDTLAPAQSYPPITVTVNVAGNSPSPRNNTATVASSGAEAILNNNSAVDSTTIVAGTQGSLTVTKSGSGTGTVASQDGGINCGATCVASYVEGSKITLSAAPAGGTFFTGWLGAGCTGTGACVVTISGATLVSATFALTPPVGTRILDIDADNTYDALTDGLLVIRYLFGLSGNALTSNAIGPAATRSAAQIASYLNDIRPYLDVDGNSAPDALTDGLLIIRHLFGLSGSGLTQGAIGPSATRTTAQQVLDYLMTLRP